MFTNLQMVHRGHQRVVRYTNEIVRAELSRGEQFAQDHIRQFPEHFKHRQGRLWRGTKGRVFPYRDGRRLILSNAYKHAAAHDLGSGLYGPKHAKYAILPRRTKFLRFVARDGHVVFTRKVMHPGVRPSRFLYRATYAYFRVLGPNLQQRMSQIARRF
jgi:hypothetical protein